MSRTNILVALCVLAIAAVQADGIDCSASYNDYLAQKGVTASTGISPNAEANFQAACELANEMFGVDAELTDLTAVADWDKDALDKLGLTGVLYTRRRVRFDPVAIEDGKEQIEMSDVNFDVMGDMTTLSPDEKNVCASPLTTNDVCNYSWAYAAKAVMDTAYVKVMEDPNVGFDGFSIEYIKECIFDKEEQCNMMKPEEMFEEIMEHMQTKGMPFEVDYVRWEGDSTGGKGAGVEFCNYQPRWNVRGFFEIQTPEQPNRGGLMAMMSEIPTMVLVGVKMDPLRFTGRATGYTVAKEVVPVTEQSDEPTLFAIAKGYATYSTPDDSFGFERDGIWFLQTRPNVCFATHLNLPMTDSEDDGNFAGIAAYAVGLVFHKASNSRVRPGNPLLKGFDSANNTLVINDAVIAANGANNKMILYNDLNEFDGINMITVLVDGVTFQKKDLSSHDMYPPNDIDFGTFVPYVEPTPGPTQGDIERDYCEGKWVDFDEKPTDTTELQDWNDNHCNCWYEEGFNEDNTNNNPDYSSNQCRKDISKCPNGSIEHSLFDDPDNHCGESSLVRRRLQTIDGTTWKFGNSLYIEKLIIGTSITTDTNRFTEISITDMHRLRTLHLGTDPTSTRIFLPKVKTLNIDTTTSKAINHLIFEGRMLPLIKSLDLTQFPNLQSLTINGANSFLNLNTIQAEGLRRMEKIVIRGENAVKKLEQLPVSRSFRNGFNTYVHIQKGALNGATKFEIQGDALTNLYTVMISGAGRTPATASSYTLAKAASLVTKTVPYLRTLYFAPNEIDLDIPTEYENFAAFLTNGLSLDNVDIAEGMYEHLVVDNGLDAVTTFNMTRLRYLEDMEIKNGSLPDTNSIFDFTDNFEYNNGGTLTIDGSAGTSSNGASIILGYASIVNINNSFGSEPSISLKGSLETREIKFGSGFASATELRLEDMPLLRKVEMTSGSFGMLTNIYLNNISSEQISVTAVSLANVVNIHYCGTTTAATAQTFADTLVTSATNVVSC